MLFGGKAPETSPSYTTTSDDPWPFSQAQPLDDNSSREHPFAEDLDLDNHPLTEGLENLIISPSGNAQYLGSSSSTILSRRLRNIIGISSPLNVELDIDKEIPTYNLQALRLYRPSFTEVEQLPPYAVAKRYFAAQHTMIGTIFAFVRLDEFEYQLQQAYAGPPDPDDLNACLVHCQVYLVMAFGQLYAVNQYMGSEGPPGFGFFTQALQDLPNIHDEPSMLFCGVLALVGYFMQILNRRDAAFLYLGVAQRMAISLALHEEVSVPGLDDFTKEQRRRTWWSIYSLDRILCVKYGNPVTMHDEDISVALPSRLPQEPEYCAAVVLRYYTVLSQILGQIMHRIYGKQAKSGPGLMTAVQEIMGALAKWEREIPNELRFDPVRITASRESVSTFLHYYQCINMTARPLLFHIVKKRLQADPVERLQDWREGLSQTTVSVIEACLLAARDTVSMMKIAAEKDLVAVFGYMDGEHAFSAAIVLVMVCVAFPPTADNMLAMNSALSTLENMARKGNHHIEARHQLLVQLSSVAVQDPCSQISVSDGSTHGASGTAAVPAPPVMYDELLNQMFASSPSTGDLTMFEAAYLGTGLDIEFDLNQWAQTAMN